MTIAINKKTFRHLMACTAIVGAITGAAAFAAPGIATAEPDQTGWDHIDPFGYHHDNDNPIVRAQQQEHRRDYHERMNQPDETINIIDSNSTTSWQPAARQDGEGWVVCKPQARHCG